MHQSVTEERRGLVGAAAVMSAVAVLMGTDLVVDYGEGAAFWHLALEGCILVLSLVSSTIFGRRWLTLRRETHRLRGELLASQRDVERWQLDAAHWREEARDILQGLSVAIDREFERWQLSGAEREVALLVLKGLSYAEIAELRGVRERTVRSQVSALLRKAGLQSRAELSAYFLEDLLLPSGQGTNSAGPA